MKKLFTLIFLLFGIGLLDAQNFLSQQWNVEITSDDGGHPSVFKRYFFGNDSMIAEDKVYWPLIESSVESGNSGLTYGFFREEGDVIFKYVTENDDEFLYYDLPLGEVTYYDFGLQVGDTINSYIGDHDIVVTKVDSFELMDGSQRKSIHLECLGGGWLSNATWVDGIGDLRHGFEGVRLLCEAPEGDWTLQCFYDNSSILYMNPEADECFLVSTSDILEEDVSIYPNPSNVTIWVEGLDKEVSFQIFNQFGKKIKEGKTKSYSINIENLPRGSYFLSFQIEDNLVTKPIIKI